MTHNYPEGIKGASAVADAIMIMRYAEHDKDEIENCKGNLRDLLTTKYGYDLSQTLDEIRPSYRFNESCQETVPQAVTAFLESTDFEDAIRNAISVGGDSDTLAATGSSTTTTTLTRFQTSSDPIYVGPDGDVFVGYSTNI
ncbi:MAG: ADP-ribosylglycohydrolase family protein, partial [Eubacteriales bacterium]|nr:ADP-ribosylglycohydrolase family protein [Eubacteriales bacterium]